MSTMQTLQKHSLSESVETALSGYFSQLGDATPSDVYEMVMAEVEVPVLKCVLKYTGGNQSEAAKILGLSRGTVRKKLKMYGMEGRIKDIITE
jgi:Fis family transcriptional regulator, factor for inversion stimulation protein